MSTAEILALYGLTDLANLLDDFADHVVDEALQGGENTADDVRDQILDLVAERIDAEVQRTAEIWIERGANAERHMAEARLALRAGRD